MLKGKVLVLGVTGSIAAYKAADLASKLTQAGAEVNVIMTRAAAQFITPLTFRSLTHCPVVTDMFELSSEFAVEHVALAQKADVVVVAPASANTIAKMAAGIADEMLTATVLATPAPVIVAPAMDAGMFANPATQENLGRLRERGFVIVGPAAGRLASGLSGPGRMVEVPELLAHISMVLGRKGDLAGRRVVVSAGGTQEPLDPVRHISNRSSGKMGYALAEAARDRGAQVVLVTAPTALTPPPGVEVVPVGTTAEMREAVLKAVKGADALLMAAAPADYRPAKMAPQKMKKEARPLTLELVPTPDILAETSGPFLKVGFAAESQDLEANAQKKLREKNLDLIVANDITDKDSGFNVDTNRVVLFARDGGVERLPLLPKREVADKVLDKVVALLAKR